MSSQSQQTRQSYSIGILMDPIETIKPYKDSTFAMMLEAQKRGHSLYYFQQDNLHVIDGIPSVNAQQIEVHDSPTNFYTLGQIKHFPLTDFDAVLMRKDPPFDMEYIYTTYILEMAEQHGTLIVNPPAALRSVNEKFFITSFPELTPKTLVTRDISAIKEFVQQKGDTVIKPMDGMGGMGIFHLHRDDSNINAILESLGNGKQTLMVQQFLSGVVKGDTRILLVNGEAPQHGLARIPQHGEFRANLAAGGKGVVRPLTLREQEICAAVKPKIQECGLLFVGLDVIDGYITEINVTSPTCIREIAKETEENIAERLIFAIEKRCAKVF